MTLLHRFTTDGLIECGCDEAGRGALAGDLYAAAVIWPGDLDHPQLRDSKKLSSTQRDKLRIFIEKHSVAWAIGVATVEEIYNLNILHASILAMQRAIEGLPFPPQRLLIDGNYYSPRPNEVEYHTIIKGDDRYLAIAAASILAKTHRDEYISHQAKLYPHYGWEQNKGYPTARHREAILRYGASKLHRQGFRLLQCGSLFNLEDLTTLSKV
jgi:Ribonuclease HII